MLMQHKGRTDIEIKMAEMLNANHVQFTEQVALYDRWVADFVISGTKVVIFCDGIYWHSKPSVVAKDKGQTNYLTKCGWCVLGLLMYRLLNTLKSVLLK